MFDAFSRPPELRSNQAKHDGGTLPIAFEAVRKFGQCRRAIKHAGDRVKILFHYSPSVSSEVRYGTPLIRTKSGDVTT